MHNIELNNLSLTYSDRVIIKDFNANIDSGEFIGIFGPNGAGKTTLLRSILGLLQPTTGSIKVFGKPARRGHTAIGYIPQMREMLTGTQLSGRARISSSRNGFKWGLPILTKQERLELEWALTLVEAQDYAHRPFAQLSGGERQRLLLAQALLDHPQILLLDEPLTNLDPHYQDTWIDLVQRIRTQLNVTVLFTAHDINPLLNVMNRVIYLAHGNAAIGPVEEVITSKKLSWLYGTPIEVVQYQGQLFVINAKSGINQHGAHHHNPLIDA